MQINKDECPKCNNKNKEKIVIYKDRESVYIYKCLECDFKWGIAKEEN